MGALKKRSPKRLGDVGVLKNGEEDRELLKSKSMVDPGITTSISVFFFSLSPWESSALKLKRVSELRI